MDVLFLFSTIIRSSILFKLIGLNISTYRIMRYIFRFIRV